MVAEAAAQDQRKRTVDALERRFALAKAELQQQQKRQFYEKKDIVPDVAKTTLPTDASVPSPSRSSTFRKGNVSFSGQAGLPVSEANDPAYAQLSHPVHDNLMKNNGKEILESCSRRGAVNDILHDFLRKGDFSQKYSLGSRSLKIDNWILLDNLVQGRQASSRVCIRSQLSQSQCLKKQLSMKQHKKLGSLVLPRELRKYDIFKPMHEMWNDYMSQLLQNIGKSHLGQCLLNADLHGALIHVVYSKVSSFTGVSGIMIRETAETFGIISENNKFHVVPKKASVFVFQAEHWKVTLRGDKLSLRNLGSE